MNTSIVKVEGWEVTVAAENGGEPTIRDVDLATKLGFERPRKIRELIDRYSEKLGEVLWRPTVGRQATGFGEREFETEEAWLTERQALFLTSRSKTERADEIMMLVVDVFIAARRGELHPVATRHAGPGSEQVLFEAIRMMNETMKTMVEVQKKTSEAFVEALRSSRSIPTPSEKKARRSEAEPTSRSNVVPDGHFTVREYVEQVTTKSNQRSLTIKNLGWKISAWYRKTYGKKPMKVFVGSTGISVYPNEVRAEFEKEAEKWLQFWESEPKD